MSDVCGASRRMRNQKFCRQTGERADERGADRSWFTCGLFLHLTFLTNDILVCYCLEFTDVVVFKHVFIIYYVDMIILFFLM